MDRLRLAGVLNMTAVIILELLPYGAVCNFAVSPEAGGGYVRETYSYFDMLPLGYANIGPFITAVLSCVLVTLWICGIVFESEGYYFICLALITGAAAFTSVMPVFQGLHYGSAVGIMITGLIFVSLVLSVKGAKKYGESKKFA